MTQVYKENEVTQSNSHPTPTANDATPSLLPEPINPTPNTETDQEPPTLSSLLHPKARLRIHLEDVAHPAMAAFTTHMPLASILRTAIANVEAHLFTPPSDHHQATHRPTPPHTPRWKPQEVRAVTLLLRDIDGVAYTTGSDLDEAHKEIHLSLNYVKSVIDKYTSTPEPSTTTTTTATASTSKPTTPSSSPSAPTPPPTASAIPLPHVQQQQHSPPSPSSSPPAVSSQPQLDAKSFTHELSGVITHEMVHCFQHNAHGSCPGGLIEGIADYVRTKAGLGALHWRKFPANRDTRGEHWDAGYQRTAWFLEWVEEEIGGEGCIGKLNERMRTEEWRDHGKVWEDVMNGVTVHECWTAYQCAWDGMNDQLKI